MERLSILWGAVAGPVRWLLLCAACSVLSYCAGKNEASEEWQARADKLVKDSNSTEERLENEMVEQRKAAERQQQDMARALELALGELSKRPDRMPAAARASCAGATGAELSRTDAALLARGAASADYYANKARECHQAYNRALKEIDEFNRRNAP